MAGVVLGATVTRADRRRAAGAAERAEPGRLTVLSARTLFPMSAGSEIVFRVTDDPDAVVRLRVEGREPPQAAVRQALADGLAAAEAWRDLDAAFRDGGYRVHALGKAVADPWVGAAPANGTVDDVLAGIGACLARRPGGAATAVLIAAPDVVRALPAERGPALPTLLRMTARRRLAALSGHRPYYRASYTWRDGTVDPASGRLSLVRPFDDRQRFLARVEAGATAWLAAAVPGATVCSATGVWRVLPGRVDRLTAYVIYRDEPEPGPVCLGRHALRVVTDLDGALVGAPEVIRDVRHGRGPLRLPPL